MTYTMVKKSQYKFPTERYLNIVKKDTRIVILTLDILTKH